MNVFDFSDSTQFLRAFLRKQPKRGYGILSRWALKLRVTPTLLSQIMKGKKSLGLELAHGLASEIGMGKAETNYFLLLVQYERAGNSGLGEFFREKLDEARIAARSLENRIENVKELSAETRTEYYSSWIYSGIRNLAACEEFQDIDRLAQRLGLPRPVIAGIVDFLVRGGLIEIEPKGAWHTGVKSTYLRPDSPLVAKHHQNWRLKAISRLDQKKPEDLFYTSPMSLSKKDAIEMRKLLVDMIEEIHRKADPSPEETVRCFNLDWFEY